MEILANRSNLKATNPKKMKKIRDYYTLLGTTCYEIRKKEFTSRLKAKKNKSGKTAEELSRKANLSYMESTDVGSGIHPRFMVSRTKPFSTEKVDEYVEMLLLLCNQMNDRMKGSKTDLESLHLVQYFATRCQEIPGIGPLKGQMMIQLCALFGLVPLEYYTFLPIHLNGGPGTFMMEEMGWDRDEDKNLLEWNAKIVSEMQSLYNKEFTYNMFENAACEISRLQPPDDLHFAIPSVSEDIMEKNKLSLDFESRRLQFYFRVDGNRNNSWRLQMFAGGKNKINVFPQRNGKGPFVMEWTKAKSNGHLARSTNIRVNLKYFWTMNNARIIKKCNNNES